MKASAELLKMASRAPHLFYLMAVILGMLSVSAQGGAEAPPRVVLPRELKVAAIEDPNGVLRLWAPSAPPSPTAPMRASPDRRHRGWLC